MMAGPVRALVLLELLPLASDSMLMSCLISSSFESSGVSCEVSKSESKLRSIAADVEGLKVSAIVR